LDLAKLFHQKKMFLDKYLKLKLNEIR